MDGNSPSKMFMASPAPARGMARPLSALLLVAPLLGALVASAGSSFDAQVVNGNVEVEVPVPVVLLGYPAGFNDTLVPLLDAQPVVHSQMSFPSSHPVNGRPPGFPIPFRLRPVPAYEVTQLPDATAASFFADLAAQGDLGGGLYDAPVAESLLADALAAANLTPRAEAPTLVLLHAGTRLPTPHAYRQTYVGGPLEPVRMFGETEPLVAFDTSAASIAFAAGRPYDVPLDPAASGTPAIVATLVRDATEYRLLHSPVYPISTKPCHAVTVVGVTRLGSLTMEPAWSRLNVTALRAAFEDLVNGTVHVDLKLVKTPADDPVLYALASGEAQGGLPINVPFPNQLPRGVNVNSREHVRWWVSEHWTDYWVPHAGCEAYVSVLIDGTTYDGTSGVALMDVTADRRISLSDIRGPGPCVDSEKIGSRETLPCPNEAPVTDTVIMRLVAHETGHLLGLNHPHTVYTTAGTVREYKSFSSGHTAMSYQSRGLVYDFGAIDPNNWARNRVETAFERAGGAAADPVALAAALDAMSRQDWQAAYDVLAAA